MHKRSERIRQMLFRRASLVRSRNHSFHLSSIDCYPIHACLGSRAVGLRFESHSTFRIARNQVGHLERYPVKVRRDPKNPPQVQG